MNAMMNKPKITRNIWPLLALAAIPLATIGATGARAQGFFHVWTDRYEDEEVERPLPPARIVEILRDRGFRPIGAPNLQGDVVVALVQDDSGLRRRVVLDAYDGEILRVRALDRAGPPRPPGSIASRDDADNFELPHVVPGVGPRAALEPIKPPSVATSRPVQTKRVTSPKPVAARAPAGQPVTVLPAKAGDAKKAPHGPQPGAAAVAATAPGQANAAPVAPAAATPPNAPTPLEAAGAATPASETKQAVEAKAASAPVKQEAAPTASTAEPPTAAPGAPKIEPLPAPAPAAQPNPTP